MKRIVGILMIVAVIVISVLMVVSKPKKELSEGAIQPELILNKIKVLNAQERDGDELYLTLNARLSGEFPEYMRIPAKPTHWLSSQMDSVEDVRLWSGPIVEGSSAIVVIELNEQDAEPLNPDDLLGVMRVRLKNEKGSLSVEWDVPNRSGIDAPKKLIRQGSDTVVQEVGKTRKFNLDNNGAHYEVFLSVNE